MVSQRAQSESEDEEYLSAHDQEDESSDEEEPGAMEPPRHPVPEMQAAFEESIRESTEDDERPKSLDNGPEARRQKVLESGTYDDSWMTRWRQKPGARHHPLLKLMAQIVFGMHLLQQQAAKSDEEVVKILQTHVDEVDNFLEKTTEDFDLAIKDINERIHFLKLPMEHKEVFETMLEDKQFRTQLLDGNDKIEKIIDRTTRAMSAALLDVQKGKLATKELGLYLTGVKDQWPSDTEDLDAIYGAMQGNEQGWKHCLKDLQKKGIELKGCLTQLATVIGEMSSLAAAASRKQRPHSRAGSVAASMTTIPRSKFSSDKTAQKAQSGYDKPLPREPEEKGGAVRMTVSKQHPVPFAQRYESPRPTPQSPTRTGARSSTVPPRPKTSGSLVAREARSNSRSNMAELASFFRDAPPPTLKRSNTDLAAMLPLRSNPPGDMVDRGGSIRSASATIVRPRGNSAVDVMEHARAMQKAPDGVARASTFGPNGLVQQQQRPGSEAAHSRRLSKMSMANGETSAEPKADSFAKYVPSIPFSPTPVLTPPSTRFGRRLSVRRKNLASPTTTSTERSDSTSRQPISEPPTISDDASAEPSLDPSQLPPDSAYAPSARLKPITESNGTTVPIQRATSPRLGLFPTTEPLTPSAASTRSYQTEGFSPAKSSATKSVGTAAGSNGNVSGSVNGSGVGQRQQRNGVPAEGKERKSRGMSLRKLFGGHQSARAPGNRATMTYGDLA